MTTPARIPIHELLKRRAYLRSKIMTLGEELISVELAIRDIVDAEDAAMNASAPIVQPLTTAKIQIQRDVELSVHPRPGALTEDQLEFEQESRDARYTMLDDQNDRESYEIAMEREQENAE